MTRIAERSSVYDLHATSNVREDLLEETTQLAAWQRLDQPDGLEGWENEMDHEAALRPLPGHSTLARETDSPLPDPVTREHLRALSADAPGFEELDRSTSSDAVDAKLRELESMLTTRANAYGGTAALLQFFTGNPGLLRSYVELYAAMAGDIGQIKGWQDKPRDEKIALFNRMSLEASVEIRHNVALTDGSQAWTRDEILKLDETLLSLPSRFALENPTLSEFQRNGPAFDPISGRPIGGDASQAGVIRIMDLQDATGAAISGVTERTIVHELAHFMDDENPRWQEFKTISGWRDVDQTLADSALARYGDGDKLRGWELGFADAPDEEFIIQRHANRTFAFKASEQTRFARPYGRSNPVEDFATSVEEFYADPENLKDKSPAKYEFMRRMFED